VKRTTLSLSMLFLTVVMSTIVSAETRLTIPRETDYYYIDPLRIIPLTDGTHFIISQPHSFTDDPEAMTGATFDASGRSIQFFDARHGLFWPRDIFEGTAGQLYGAVLLPDTPGKPKRMVLSAGYRSANGDLKFALLIVRDVMDGGIWRAAGRVDGIGQAGDLAVTEDGAILAVTVHPEGNKAHPALTLVSADGNILKTYFPREAVIDRGRLFVRARLQSLGGDRFAFNDGLSELIEIFRIDPRTRELAEHRTIAVSALRDDGNTAHVQGWHVNVDKSVTVIRRERRDHSLLHLVSQWTPDGTLLSESNEGPVFGSFWKGDDLQLVRRSRGEVYFETADVTSRTTQSSSPPR